MKSSQTNIAIVGTQGVPAHYGGFETLAENLVAYAAEQETGCELTVYCSSTAYSKPMPHYKGAHLKYLPISANGILSIPYDILSLALSIWRGADVILLLGVSGAVCLPFFRLLSRTRIVTNVDGIEWKRSKWGLFARTFLKLSEYCAVRFSDQVVADNPAIAAHILERYGREFQVVSYGGDHALSVSASPYDKGILPPRYALAISRIEPENNVHTILKAFAERPDHSFVYVGNWNANSYARQLVREYEDTPNLSLLPAEYDVGKLRTLRENAQLYVHGHSTGGTNPSLVEMMHFACPVLAYDCSFNRHTTGDKALYFSDAPDLQNKIDTLANNNQLAQDIAGALQDIAQEEYTWSKVAAQYFEMFKATNPKP